LADKRSEELIKAIKRVMRYLQGTKKFGLIFGGKVGRKMAAYVDASFAECVATRKSTSGILIRMFGGPVWWQSKLQS
jgi:hypothetical protein